MSNNAIRNGCGQLTSYGRKLRVNLLLKGEEKGRILSYKEVAKLESSISGNRKVSGSAIGNFLCKNPKVRWKRERNRVRYENVRREGQQFLRSIVSSINSPLERLASQIDSFALQKAEKEGAKRDYEDAIKYLYSIQVNVYSFDLLYDIFKRHSQAEARGEKLSLVQMGKEFDMWPSAIRRVLMKVGRTGLNGTWVKKTIPKEKKEAINLLASKTNLSPEDIAYFVGGIKPFNASQHYSTKGPKGRRFVRLITRFPRDKNLNRKACALIYEAQDAGFPLEEVMEYANASERGVMYANRHAKKIQSFLMKILKMAHPNKEITKPYRED